MHGDLSVFFPLPGHACIITMLYFVLTITGFTNCSTHPQRWFHFCSLRDFFSTFRFVIIGEAQSQDIIIIIVMLVFRVYVTVPVFMYCACSLTNFSIMLLLNITNTGIGLLCLISLNVW